LLDFCRRLQHVGNIQNAVFDVSQKSKHVVVSSKENVVAALSMSTGNIGNDLAW